MSTGVILGIAVGATGVATYLRSRMRRGGGAQARSTTVPLEVLDEALAGLLESCLAQEAPRDVAIVAADCVGTTLGLPDATVLAPAPDGGWEMTARSREGWHATEPPPGGVPAWLGRNNHPIFAAELADKRFGALRVPLGELMQRFGSTLLVPVASPSSELLAIALLPIPGRLGADERRFIDDVHLEASAAASNARLAKDAAHKIGLSREVDLARAVERELLPAQPVLSSGPLKVAGARLAASPSSGDFWSCHELGQGRLLLWSGTVAARGVSAAMVGAVAKGASDAALLADRSGSPVAVAAAVHESLRRRAGMPLLLQGTIALIDAPKRELRVVGAGGPFPLRLSREGDAAVLTAVGARGVALGDRVDHTFREVSAPLQPGDVIVLYTPGLVGAQNAAGEPFGDRRFLRALRKVVSPERVDAVALRDMLLAEVAEHIGSAAPREDRVLVVVRA